MARNRAEIPNVEIVHAGTFKAKYGKVTFTDKHIEDMAKAFNDPTYRKPGLVSTVGTYIGHDGGPLTNPKGYQGDDRPQYGRLANVVAKQNSKGQLALFGDLVDLPRKIAKIAKVAWPSRSIEARINPDGSDYSMVMTGVALLGQTLPAVEDLEDLADLFEDEAIAASGTAITVTLTPELDEMENEIVASVEEIIQEEDAEVSASLHDAETAAPLNGMDEITETTETETLEASTETEEVETVDTETETVEASTSNESTVVLLTAQAEELGLVVASAEDFQELQLRAAKYDELVELNRAAERDAFIQAVLDEGKISAAQVDTARQMYDLNEEVCRTHYASAPVVIPTGTPVGHTNEVDTDDSSEADALLKKLGLRK